MIRIVGPKRPTSATSVVLSLTWLNREGPVTNYEVHAIKYAERDAVRAEHFIGGDPHDNAPMPMDYFIWLIRSSSGQEWVVDTGFEQDDAQSRNRTLLRTAAEGVALLGVDSDTVSDVIMTHFHYDHAGGVNQFPNATFHVQDDEMSFATGRDMTHKAYRHAFNVRHIKDFVDRVFSERVTFHAGDAELSPGLTLHHIGGHTRGLQVVRIDTGSSVVVLASDASHYWANMDEGRPFPIVDDLSKMIQGWETLRYLAGSNGVIVPGHDPLVFERFLPSSPELEGVAVRLG
ncbi:MAG TPA: N-acyl homoserine lactonase family protein [Acidimicrobiia bacterium]|jgi:glyoxylase-like metal-dependent hydrolase (beta-lactamase superfamily II)|nr:N-acyl homoserine lactonase family protein [Acidimicrobiia bacterium]HIL06493.1 N-acyl homoserine lactonase family protein [Acidimicrobiia bacterium]